MHFWVCEFKATKELCFNLVESCPFRQWDGSADSSFFDISNCHTLVDLSLGDLDGLPADF